MENCIHCGKVRGQGFHHHSGPARHCQKGQRVGEKHIWGTKSMRILHHTPGRSGSTFITQILKHLYEQDGQHNVQATHSYVDTEGKKVVLTIRDFRDVMVSWWRTHTNLTAKDLDAGRKMTSEEVDDFLGRMLGQIEILNKMDDNNPVRLIMRYDKFYPNNFDYIFSYFDTFFGEISEEDKKAIRDKFSFNKNIERQKKYKHFGENDNN